MIVINITGKTYIELDTHSTNVGYYAIHTKAIRVKFLAQENNGGL